MTTADRIRRAAARIAGYTVIGAGFNARHHTLTLRAALEWAACYPAATITRRGHFIASKTTGA
jgi:hypothetical protein